MTNQQGAPEALDDLYLKLHGLSKRLEGSGLIDEDDAPEAYPAILAAMNLVWRLQREQSAALVEAQQPAPSAAAAEEAEREGLRVAIRSAIQASRYHFVDPVRRDTADRVLLDLLDDINARTAAPQPSPTPQADSQPVPDQRQQLDAYYSLLDAMGWESKRQHISPETWAADLLRDATAYRAARAPADSVLEDAAFEAVRKKLCALPRYSFVLDDDGLVRRVQERAGNWIEFDDAHELFDPIAVDAARKQGANHD